jgi:hypothetical protein
LDSPILPFLKHEPKSPGIAVVERKPDEGKEDPDAGLHACAQDLINAIHSKDMKAVAAALKAAFELLDSAPHEEGPHLESEEE